VKPKKIAVFYQTAGKTQLPKRLIVGKDRAAGKVLAGKSVHSAFLWFVGSKGENASPQPFMKKAGYRFPEKVAVASEQQSGSFLEQDSTEVPKFALRLFLPLRESCWGVPSPNPAMRPVGRERRSQTMRKKYNTPHRRHVVKTRMTDEEYADFTGRLAAYEISQSEFIRQAIRKATIRPIVTVSPVNDGLLAALSKLTAEYGKIGGNLNQIARSLNEYGSPYRGLEKEVRGAAADLAALKFEVLQKVGEAVGDTQTYQL
jgi:hypothetical protein